MLEQTKHNPLLRYLGYMNNPLSWAMEAAAIIAIALLDYADFVLIVFLLILNATVAYYEEAGADKAIQALQGALAPKARVFRDGELTTMDAKELVPGDVVVVQFGNVVAADVKLLGAEDDEPLQVGGAPALVGAVVLLTVCFCKIG